MLLLLAACAAGVSPTTPSPGSTGPEPGSTTPAFPASGTPSGAGPSGSAGPETDTSADVENLSLLPTKGAVGAMMTLTGIPTSGVEARCWLLDGYLLVDVPAGLLGSGQRITVTGRVEQDLMTTCQQGIPLRVESADAA